jgi:prevent-host-death family protein
MTVITANELKTKGVSGLEKSLRDAQEVIVSVRGKPRYVVMEIEQYELLRESEIEAAWYQTKADITAGRFQRESADDHMARIATELDDEL